MAMTSFQITLLRSSMVQLQPIGEIVTALFYRRLFAINPGLRLALGSASNTQGRLLMDTMGTVVGAAHDLQQVRATLLHLAHCFVATGVRPSHIDALRTAWVGTLDGALAEDFTPELRQAWLALCSEVAELLRPAAPLAPPALPAAPAPALPASRVTKIGDGLAKIGTITRRLFSTQSNASLQRSLK
jgi:hemoglobin-like flavoprotein